MTKLFIGLAITVGLFTGSRAFARAPKPTIVLVHGAFADASSWTGVIKILRKDGYVVMAPANPLRGVKSDGQYIGSLLGSLKESVVLVGHSYGGSVITEAANDHPNVKALVYVAGFAPAAGETAAGLSSKFQGSTLGPALAPPVPLSGGSKDLYILQDKFPAQFAADVPVAQAALMAVTQRPITDAQLHSEMDRMARHSRAPEILHELFAALGNDPFVIAETSGHCETQS